jgi:AraC-like DNA-binding protein
MSFSVALPARALRPYIVRYWSLRATFTKPEQITLPPDGGVHLLFVLGDPVRSGRFATTFGGEHVHFVGAMLRADRHILAGDQHLLGVTFEPAGFPCFYRWEALRDVADGVHPFEHDVAIDPRLGFAEIVRELDRHWLSRLGPPRSNVLDVLADIKASAGKVRIDHLLKRHAMTARTLERHFARDVGITPKELIDVTRFRSALATIALDRSSRSLMEVAWDCGYYDNAHLTREFQRFMGEAPSRLVLSDLSKSASG